MDLEIHAGCRLYEETDLAELIYYPQRGYGVMEPDETTQFVYDDAYFQNFENMGQTLRGDRLMTMRAILVRDVICDEGFDLPFVDVGIGSGAFIEKADMFTLQKWKGFDRPDQPFEWLTQRDRWHDLRVEFCDVATFWDSLEHCTEQEAHTLLNHVRKFAFISMPIYENGDAITSSKHFKPGEHILYFTERGLIGWMFDRGFELVDRNRIEERCGRDGIGTFAFTRVRS